MVRKTLFIGRFLRDQGGASIVEFGFIAPIIVAFFMAVLTGATWMAKYNAMHTGVSSGAQYVMAGGADLDTVRAVTQTAWPAKSGAANVSAAKVCRCGTVVSTCSNMCADGTAPQAFITITASDVVSVSGLSKTIASSQEVRVR
jgi:Flp pilus assembly protein TadG